MSFLTRFTPLTARVASTPAIRTTPALGLGAARSISSTGRRQSGPVDATKETLKKADRVVSDAAVKGIEKGEQAAGKIKDTVGKTTGEAEAQASELKGEAAEMAGKGKGKAEEALGQGKGKAEEALGEAKGKAKETASHLKS
ncbi:LEA domain protein [Aspergillus terreus]|uniref:LEA domain protein n=1 Tax=Aspergillus terreus TaxID=33178 RepID=A0A5M3YPS2_ASPTE|nr:hypothetical protein ATETN484_0002069500 [Aspergillus terreus]GFF15551.1 LEA domain protein [Aspergillus terreus]